MRSQLPQPDDAKGTDQQDPHLVNHDERPHPEMRLAVDNATRSANPSRRNALSSVDSSTTVGGTSAENTTVGTDELIPDPADDQESDDRTGSGPEAGTADHAEGSKEPETDDETGSR